MVLIVTGLGAAAVPVLGAATASLSTSMAVAASGAAVLGEGASVGAAVLAIGEGACFAVGAAGGPIGWAVVGCNKNNDHNNVNNYTWDCWKPVVMDDSVGLSRGITLRDLHNHPNLNQLTIDGNDFVAENIRGERFRLCPVEVEGTLAFHASLM